MTEREHPMGSFLWVWNHTNFSFLLSQDLGRLRGPVPATLGRLLEHVVEGPKSIPGQEDIGQLRFYEPLRDLENKWARSSGACGSRSDLGDLRGRTNCYPPNGMVRRLRPRRGRVELRLLPWGMEGVS